jgi:radical SAM protein with 4Fe4S-binding SPASM domain
MRERTRKCFQPWDTINVGADGGVYPCCVVADALIIGSLKTDSLQEILEGESLRTLRFKLLTGELIDVCKDCNNADLIETTKFAPALEQYLIATARSRGDIGSLRVLPNASIEPPFIDRMLIYIKRRMPVGIKNALAKLKKMA